MKKKLPLMIVIIGCILALFFTGVGILNASANQAQTRHASPNYFYLPQPRMLTADANNVFVVNGVSADSRLLAFNTSGNLILPPPSHPISPNVIFIKHAGNFIFLFEETGFTVLQFNANRTFTDRTGTFGTVVGRHQYRTAGLNNFQLFDVQLISGNTYRIFFASTDTSTPRFGWTDFTLSGTSWMRNDATSFLSNDFAESNSIRAISADGSGRLYITALYLWGAGETLNIYQVNLTPPATSNPTLVNIHPLSQFTSFSVVRTRGTFVYIDNNRGLTLFDRARTGNPFVVTPDNAPPDAFSAAASRDPYFVTTTANGQFAYVIDREKQSIDRYIIRPDSTLEFDAVIVAHIGGDRGFFNTPTSLTLINSSVHKGNDITSSEYLVTDRAGQVMMNRIDANGRVTATPFFADTSTRLSASVRATYDNFDTVYIFDQNPTNGENRVRTFTMDGVFSGHEFTNFGRITNMFADANRTIYAIDATQARIHIFGIGVTRTYVEIPPEFAGIPLLQVTTGTFSEQLNSIVLANATNQVIILSLDGTFQVLTVAENVLDVATDTLGNLVLLTQSSGNLFINSHAQTGTTFGTTFTWRRAMTGATIAQSNPSLNLDRMNGRILYIGARHAIESFELAGTGIWSPQTHQHDTDWMDTSAPLHRFDPEDLSSTPIFFEAIGSGAVIYQYPNGTRALGFAPRNSVLKVLNYDTHYVLYQNALTGTYIKGYVSPRAVTATQPYTEELEFEDARVMFSQTMILKFPTTDRRSLAPGQTLSILTLEKNFGHVNRVGGLRLFGRLTVLDVQGFAFYEIRLSRNPNGTFTPSNNPNAPYVGFINASNIIDYHLGPSIPSFLPNATVRFNSSHTTRQAQVYERSDGILTELPNEFLISRQNIRVIGRFNPNHEFTFIHYWDSEVNRTRDGWIRTEYIAMNGLSAIQIIAIAVLSLLALGGATFTIVYIRKRGE